MADRLRFDGMTAVITGAGSGIGQALAVALAKRRVRLALSDIREQGLNQTLEMLGDNPEAVITHVMDVAAPEAPTVFAEKVKAEFGGANLVFNNAGIAVGGTFDRLPEEDFDRVMDVNFHAVVRMTRAFLPQMKQMPVAQLVNISSIFGIIAPPGQTAYSAAKFAVRGFSMSLAHELEGSNVGVTVVHPGGVNTRIAEDAKKPADATNEEITETLERARQALVMPPPEAAEIILRHVEKRARRVIVGRDAHTLLQLERFFPTSYLNFVKNRLS